MAKNILKSKLFWLGTINIVVGILNYIAGSISNGNAITINGIAIIVLRLLTNQPVKLK